MPRIWMAVSRAVSSGSVNSPRVMATSRALASSRCSSSWLRSRLKRAVMSMVCIIFVMFLWFGGAAPGFCRNGAVALPKRPWGDAVGPSGVFRCAIAALPPRVCGLFAGRLRRRRVAFAALPPGCCGVAGGLLWRCRGAAAAGPGSRPAVRANEKEACRKNGRPPCILFTPSNYTAGRLTTSSILSCATTNMQIHDCSFAVVVL